MADRASGERAYPRHPDIVRQAVSQALARLGWEIGAGSEGAMAAAWTSPIFRFRDDVSIEIVPQQKETRVRVRSASRVGKYDFGQNARHVREFFGELERQLPST